MDALNSATVLLNQWGSVFCNFAGHMLIQSSILIGLLLLVDLCLRARVSARFRYGMWLLVLVKLVLPPSLALPTGITYWLSSYLPAAPAMSAPPAPAVSLAPLPFVQPLGDVMAAPFGATQTALAGRELVSLQGPGLILLAWVAGILLLTALVLRRLVSVRRSLHLSCRARRQMMELLEECRANLGVAAPVTVRVTEDMRSPCVCGFARPVILLPAVLPPSLGPDGLRTILTHELAHIKRRDPWVSLAQTVLQIAYFWHPLVWAANTRLRHLRELAVDETVVVTLRAQARCYTDTLIDIAEMAFRKPALSLRLMGIAESRRALERRIKHMLNRRIFKRPALGLSGLLTIMALGAVLVPMGRGTVAAPAEQKVAQSVPALPEGIAELFEQSKDDILKKFGEPKHIFLGDETYTLDNLPDRYFLCYEDISFGMNEGAVGGITLVSPTHVFGNGIRVGDSEEKVKQAFGPPSEVEETDFKDFLIYESLGLSFEVKKQDRSVMNFDIARDYGDPVRLQAHAAADEFAAQLPEKIAQFDIDSADLKKVIETFGEPMSYIWGRKTLAADDLPRYFIAVYPGRFQVFMADNCVVEVRHERSSEYAFAGRLKTGSTLDEALAVLGPPVKTVVGEPIDWDHSQDVLFRDIEGHRGSCYYSRPGRSVRVWFSDNRVAAIYMTRSREAADDSQPFDPEFARLLAERIVALDIVCSTIL